MCLGSDFIADPPASVRLICRHPAEATRTMLHNLPLWPVHGYSCRIGRHCRAAAERGNAIVIDGVLHICSDPFDVRIVLWPRFYFRVYLTC
jgi:hypothetical protein